MSPVSADSQIGVVRTIKALRARVDAWRTAGETIGFVPTMGALHEGHLSLVRKAGKLSDRTLASIFVNPAQFAPHEDFSSYPRTEAADLEKLQGAGCVLAYAPGPEQMYPPGFQTSIRVEGLSQGLCGASRPHFFGGVATVVCKLLNQVRPTIAVFGEKDFQQLQVIRRMVRDLDIPVEIVGGPIVREPDGLAMSSRNAYLSAAERATAGRLNRVIAEMATALAGGAAVGKAIAEGRAALESAGVDRVDYLEVRAENDLAPLTEGPIDLAAPARVFAAIIVGKTRLIDNWPIRRAE
jgi:pantoate--beta-alanine ligase